MLRAGLFGWDYAALAGTPVARLPWGLPAPGARAWAARAESLLVLVGVALAARAFLVRLLGPWTGPHPARTAALVTALLIPLHPAAPLATADLAGRNEIVGLLLGFSAAALFLRGRQEQREALTIASLVLLVAAGCASKVAVLLALVLAFAELASARRHRKTSLRVRTAATTAAVFSAGALVPSLLGARPEGAGATFPVPFAEELRARVLAVTGELGRVAAPAGEGLGVSGALFAGLILLAALHPAFRAARQAPRLWGGILVIWSAALAVALGWASTGASGRGLFAVVVWTAGLSLTITALARPWRAGLAAAVALGWSILAHAGARPWAVGSRALAELHAEVHALAPGAARVFVIDPPAVVGLRPLAQDLGWAFRDPEDAAAGTETEFDPDRVQGLSRAAFLVLVRTEGFARMRDEKPVVLVRGRELVEVRDRAGWRAVELPARWSSAALPRTWRSGALTYTPEEPLDPLEIELVRIVAELSTVPPELARLAWRTRAGELGSCAGDQAERGGRRVAEFDLSSSLAWRLAGSVRSLLVEKGKREIESGEVHARLPPIAGLGAPEVAGGDWVFPRADPPDPAPPGTRPVLALLALGDLELVELPLEPEPDGALRARGAQRVAARAGAQVAWEVEYRRGEHALLRSRGSFP